jgi:hypothetical protein
VWNGNEHFFSTNIDAGRVRVQHRQHTRAAFAFAFAFRFLAFSHSRLLLPEPAARDYELSKLLNEIAAETTSSLTCT